MAKKLVILGLIVISCSLTIMAAVPQGWSMWSSNSTSVYEAGTDPQVLYNDHPSAYVRCEPREATSTTPANECKPFGSFAQNFSAEQYLGKRVRVSAYLKCDNVKDWTGLWMRIDKGTSVVGFDNMQSKDRQMGGTLGWQRKELVLDVPDDATQISFGIILSGPGAVWINSVKFEVVGTDVPLTTNKPEVPQAPANLGFDN